MRVIAQDLLLGGPAEPVYQVDSPPLDARTPGGIWQIRRSGGDPWHRWDRASARYGSLSGAGLVVCMELVLEVVSSHEYAMAKRVAGLACRSVLSR